MSALKKKEDYESPSTKKAQVEIEEGICVASGADAKIKKEDVNIEVKEYTEIDNSISFD